MIFATPVAIRLQFTICCQRGRDQLIDLPSRRRGREAEGGGLLNRYTVKSRIEGSNPSVSANNTVFQPKFKDLENLAMFLPTQASAAVCGALTG